MSRINRREGGLWMFAPGKTDADWVLEAKKKLAELLEDPYGAEALDELKRERPELFVGVPGPKPERGTRAATIQWGRKKAGRPATERAKADRAFIIAHFLVKWRKVRGLLHAATVIAKQEESSLKGRRLKKRAHTIRQQIYDARRRWRNLKKPPSFTDELGRFFKKIT